MDNRMRPRELLEESLTTSLERTAIADYDGPFVVGVEGVAQDLLLAEVVVRGAELLAVLCSRKPCGLLEEALDIHHSSPACSRGNNGQSGLSTSTNPNEDY